MRALYFLTVFALAISACNCEDAVLAPARPGACEPTYACPAGFEYRRGDCHDARCATDADCCPGQICNAGAGFCADQLRGCTRDSECEVPGQTCTDFRGARYCAYPNKGHRLGNAGTQACTGNDDCDPGRTCMGLRCVTQAPCEGGCAEGTICDIDTNTCFPVDPMACNLTCDQGKIKIVKDPDTMSGPLCCKIECECATLPPVKAGSYGWYAALAIVNDEVAVSAYDPDYGDLVVARFDDEGKTKGVEYVDGFPASGDIVGDPNGPRKGLAEPGPDVGLHTSVIVDAANVMHVAYYDKDMGALRYARKMGSTWSVSTVDDEGDTGWYTSIAIGTDGSPRIAYMMVEGTIGGDPIKRTALKLATSRSSAPGASSDWTIEVVDSAPKPAPICDGGCGSGRACVDLGMGPACAATTVGCGGCMMGEACIDNAGMAECHERVAVLRSADLVEGTGLFASLAVTSTGTPLIAYYDRLGRRLRLAAATSTGTFRLRTLDASADPANEPLDVGQHASLALGPADRIGVAYMDATNDNLLYIDVTAGTKEIVDDGIMPPDLRLVGADASLLFDSQGRPAVAYQDPTKIDLIYARRLGTPPMWSTEVLDGDVPPGEQMGTASGFYVSQKRRADTAFISNVIVGFDIDGVRKLDLRVLTKLLD